MMKTRSMGNNVDTRTVLDFPSVEICIATIEVLLEQRRRGGYKREGRGVPNNIPIRTITVQDILKSMWKFNTLKQHYTYYRNHRDENLDCTIHDSTSHPNRNKPQVIDDNVVNFKGKLKLPSLIKQRDAAYAAYKTAVKEKNKQFHIRETALEVYKAAEVSRVNWAAEVDRLEALIDLINKRGH
jgi:hypothetical protein